MLKASIRSLEKRVTPAGLIGVWRQWLTDVDEQQAQTAAKLGEPYTRRDPADIDATAREFARRGISVQQFCADALAQAVADIDAEAASHP